MKAKIMFKKLGFHIIKDDLEELIYSSQDNKRPCYQKIIFKKKYNTFTVWSISPINQTYTAWEVPFELAPSIDKQIKELKSSNN